MGLRNRELKTPEERWNDALNQLSDSTAYQYKHDLEEFLEWAEGETYEGLINYWLEIRDDPMKRQLMNDAVSDYIDELYEKGYTGGKQSVILKALRKFFRANGFNVVF